MIRLKRVYEEPLPEDGRRILVERLWPRGLTKERAAIDVWLKDIAPSAALRSWFAHEPAKWEEFQARYRRELESNPETVALLRQHTRDGTVTLVYAARDTERNSAVFLKGFIQRAGPAPAAKEPRRRATAGQHGQRRKANR